MRLAISIKGGPGSGFHGHAGRPGKQGGSSITSTGNTKLPSVDTLYDAAKRIGQQLYGKDSSGLITGAGTPAFVHANPNDIVRHAIEDGMAETADSVYEMPLMDDFEFAFMYDPKTGKSSLVMDRPLKPISGLVEEGYNERYAAEDYDTNDVNDFYKRHPDKLLISYGLYDEKGDKEHTINVWKPSKISANVVKLFDDAKAKLSADPVHSFYKKYDLGKIVSLAGKIYRVVQGGIGLDKHGVILELEGSTKHTSSGWTPGIRKAVTIEGKVLDVPKGHWDLGY